ncbi:calpain-5-like [Bradysia coprophila]|uniref:calpain-5-like n=1 Tax=Bradysia coprophila TaxID=38358 RepID=UPI00187DD5E8|nr:calpain-5-like [Bradysia coprophila]
MGVEKWKKQSYRKIKKQCVTAGKLWDDPLFPPNDNSLALTKSSYSNVVWKRPSELCTNPKLFVEKASSKDVTQGSLGNCWFVAACSALATVKPLWKEVVPDYKLQEWDDTQPEQYAGIFHFRFWRGGNWIDICVDDKLPTIGNQLLFCHSTTENEFWSALLEKAYAKLCGSYGVLHGGNLCDALVDFTSGLSEVIELKENGYKTDVIAKHKLRKQLLRKHEEHALMCCAISARDSSEFEVRTKTGLVIGHAYGITAVRDINLGTAGLLSFFKGGDKLTLLRLRNPWGAKEWNGPFSDGSPEWKRIALSEQEKLGLTFEEDGEFWMHFDDFVAEFTELSICHLINTSFFTWRKTWRETMIKGEWKRPDLAGGCPNHDSFLKNPQYVFTVPKDDMEIIVQIVQADRRGIAETYNSIGFHIMRVEENRAYRIHTKRKKVITSDYVNTRSVYFQGTLKKGRHALLPTTFEPNIETEFVLRIFSEDYIDVDELTEDHPKPMWLCAPFCSMPTCVTSITVTKASQLAHSENTYCLIKVEGETLTSEVVYNSQEPEWNLSGVFFRYNVTKPIFVELWEKKVLRDTFLGCAVIASPADNDTIGMKCPLVGRGRNKNDKHPGLVHLQVATYDDLNTL